MDWRKKVLLAAAVVGVGVAGALQFRKPPGTGDAEGWSTPTSSSSGVAMPPEAAAFSGRIESPPLLPPVTESTDRTQQTAGEKIAATAEQPASNSATESPSSTDLFARFKDGTEDMAGPAVSKRNLIDLRGPERKHVIADGDTLSSIAERYLGDATRFGELYDYNRDVLRSPELLPIGVELRIPPQIPIDRSPADSQAATVATPLVPVAAPTNSTSAQTVSANAQRPRTYTVQAGDNLIDIARKLYGDGRRHEQLFEINRRVMRHPADLKPGMVLTVP